ncbi:MAG: hypothetical protein IJX99_02490 [Clostridia bacterium]|nr:hypothetical protein [Clostridia bacterium]
MATFREKFQEFLESQGVESVHSVTSVDEYEEVLMDQRKGLNQKQQREAELLVEEFFENADDIIFREGYFPVIKMENIVEVKHITCVSLPRVAQYAETMIAHQLAGMHIGNEYDVNAAYIATYDGDKQISPRLLGENSMDQYRITVEVELF